MHTDGPELDSAPSEVDLMDSESELVGQMEEVTLKITESRRRLKTQIKEKMT